MEKWQAALDLKVAVSFWNMAPGPPMLKVAETSAALKVALFFATDGGSGCSIFIIFLTSKFAHVF